MAEAVLTCETEKVRVAGKAVTAVYLVPKAIERVDDENGYTVIVKKGRRSARLKRCRASTSRPCVTRRRRTPSENESQSR